MNSSRLFLTIITLCLLFTLAVPSAIAKGKGGGGKPPVAPPPVNTKKIVESVNAATNSIVIKNMRNNSTHTYTIDNITVVKVNNTPGKFSDIKANMEVTDLVERDNDNLDSISLGGYASSAPPAAAPKKKK